MAEGDSQSGECQETAGFLFSHRCGSMAVRECADCQKPICQRHTIDLGGVLKCVSCAKAVRGGRRGRAGGPGDTADSTYYPYHAPYFYSDTYYYSSGGYPRNRWRSSHSDSSGGAEADDFTDADEAALSGGEPDGDDVRGFENDMGAS